jgi:hypothetical protein
MLHDDADLRADSLFARTINSAPGERRGLMFDSLRAALKDRFWNRSVFEMALAAKYQSTIDQKMAFAVRQYHGFLSAGFPMLGRSGQVQFGASGWGGFADQDARYQRQGSITFRTLYGSPSERLFLGGRLIATSLMAPDYRLEFGGLMRIANGLWLRPDLGVSLLDHPARGPEASVTMSFGTPEIGNR